MSIITIEPRTDSAAVAMDALRRIVRALRSAHVEGRAIRGASMAQLFVLREVGKAGLSDEGRIVLASAPETIQERLLAAFGQLSAERQHAIAQGMDEWMSAAGLGQLAPTMFFEPTLPDLTD